jgi:hypothetical protein
VRTRTWLLVVVLVLAATTLTGCGGGGGNEASSSDTTAVAASDDTTTPSTVSGETKTTPADDSTTTLPPGATAGQDDYGGDGELDPTCGTQDFGAGLVLRIPCEVAAPNEVPEGVTLVDRSLFRINGTIDVNLDGISGGLLAARDAAGTKVFIMTNNSDALFETGSATIGSTETLDNTIRLLNSKWPGAVGAASEDGTRLPDEPRVQRRVDQLRRPGQLTAARAREERRRLRLRRGTALQPPRGDRAPRSVIADVAEATRGASRLI